jgi:hypothetical protein
MIDSCCVATRGYHLSTVACAKDIVTHRQRNQREPLLARFLDRVEKPREDLIDLPCLLDGCPMGCRRESFVPRAWNRIRQLSSIRGQGY